MGFLSVGSPATRETRKPSGTLMRRTDSCGEGKAFSFAASSGQADRAARTASQRNMRGAPRNSNTNEGGADRRQVDGGVPGRQRRRRIGNSKAPGCRRQGGTPYNGQADSSASRRDECP